MKIARFLDTGGFLRLGLRCGDDEAEILDGELFGDLSPSGQRTKVSQWLAPVDPVNIFGIGLNYRAHAKETGAALPELPVVFMKPTTTVIHPGDPVRLPAACEHGPEVDYEAELAVIIGRTARNVTEAAALDHVLGYTCANDVSARHWQKNGGAGQWVRGKSFDTFCPLGPVLVTADELPDPQALGIRCLLNGQTMQEGHTADMIFPVARLIAHLARDTTLLPGTVILTGTPAGVGFTRQPPVFLARGDHVRVEIDGIGALENPVLDATD